MEHSKGDIGLAIGNIGRTWWGQGVCHQGDIEGLIALNVHHCLPLVTIGYSRYSVGI